MAYFIPCFLFLVNKKLTLEINNEEILLILSGEDLLYYNNYKNHDCLHITIFQDGINCFIIGKIRKDLHSLEIPACMGFQLCDFREGFEEFFEDKKDIIYFRSYEEIPDLIDKYTKDSFLRKQIAENGYKKVINEHSYKNRIHKIIDTVNKG